MSVTLLFILENLPKLCLYIVFCIKNIKYVGLPFNEYNILSVSVFINKIDKKCEWIALKNILFFTFFICFRAIVEIYAHYIIIFEFLSTRIVKSSSRYYSIVRE